MAVEAGASSELVKVVALLGAAVVMVPLFRKLGLGSVLGYLSAGLIIGPFGLGWFSDPQAILHTAELGVVMFLFVIGLEMRPSHLWGLRRQIFGLGALQIGLCILILTGVARLCGMGAGTAFVGAAGFVLTSTAIVMQLLSERGDIALPRGQKIVSILLFEDLLIILFAPDKGSETRDKLNDSLKDLGDAIKERSSEQMSHVNDFTDKVIATLKTKLSKGERAVEDAIEEHA